MAAPVVTGIGGGQGGESGGGDRGRENGGLEDAVHVCLLRDLVPNADGQALKPEIRPGI